LLKISVNDIDFDFSSGTIVKDSGDSNMCFRQLISDKKVNPYFSIADIGNNLSIE